MSTLKPTSFIIRLKLSDARSISNLYGAYNNGVELHWRQWREVVETRLGDELISCNRLTAMTRSFCQHTHTHTQTHTQTHRQTQDFILAVIKRKQALVDLFGFNYDKKCKSDGWIMNKHKCLDIHCKSLKWTNNASYTKSGTKSMNIYSTTESVLHLR